MATCCTYDKTEELGCQSEYTGFNVDENNVTLDCKHCSTRGLQGTGTKRPLKEEQFQEHIDWFWKDAPGINCATAGKGAYRDAVRYEISLDLPLRQL
jgi:hypothetical protein